MIYSHSHACMCANLLLNLYSDFNHATSNQIKKLNFFISIAILNYLVEGGVLRSFGLVSHSYCYKVVIEINILVFFFLLIL
jgi:hypothetical protein